MKKFILFLKQLELTFKAIELTMAAAAKATPIISEVIQESAERILAECGSEFMAANKAWEDVDKIEKQLKTGSKTKRKTGTKRNKKS